MLSAGSSNLLGNVCWPRSPSAVQPGLPRNRHERGARIDFSASTAHSPAFWARLERALPDYARRKRWLAEHGADYDL